MDALPNQIDSVFRHQIKGANKEIGVKFHAPLPKGYISPCDKIEGGNCNNYLRLASAVSNSGLPNYRKCRVQVPSSFNLQLWEDKLKTYEDQHLVNLLRCGFPLGVHNRSKLTRTVIENHSTAKQFSEAVSEYIEKEKKFGALLGPFTSPPHSLYHCSPLLTRPKDIDKCCIIVDLARRMQ